MLGWTSRNEIRDVPWKGQCMICIKKVCITQPICKSCLDIFRPILKKEKTVNKDKYVLEPHLQYFKYVKALYEPDKCNLNGAQMVSISVNELGVKHVSSS